MTEDELNQLCHTAISDAMQMCCVPEDEQLTYIIRIAPVLQKHAERDTIRRDVREATRRQSILQQKYRQLLFPEMFQSERSRSEHTEDNTGPQLSAKVLTILTTQEKKERKREAKFMKRVLKKKQRMEQDERRKLKRERRMCLKEEKVQQRKEETRRRKRPTQEDKATQMDTAF